MENYEKRNEIEQEIRKLIARRVDTHNTAIEQLLKLFDLQKQMIDSMEKRISALESRNIILR